ncbi:HTH-type transcriptional regulator [Arthrobacter saudimassiliensis]|uniref:HTH-type transcriptional regulator n=1 Tax=Arthrobacter saudimassiliensis TaxID=1461584 RepID=A0A078MQN5_9MICC|nr:HTH-type transcriptional regulator [Arthrobacter saudimassiliensis]
MCGRKATMDGAAESLDRLFRALADPTRRDILRRVGQAEHSVSALARAYPLSFAAVQKHVALLEKAGLVSKHRHGREHLVRPLPSGLRSVRTALDELAVLWEQRIGQMDALLTDSRAAPDEERARPESQEGQVP